MYLGRDLDDAASEVRGFRLDGVEVGRFWPSKGSRQPCPLSQMGKFKFFDNRKFVFDCSGPRPNIMMKCGCAFTSGGLPIERESAAHKRSFIHFSGDLPVFYVHGECRISLRICWMHRVG